MHSLFALTIIHMYAISSGIISGNWAPQTLVYTTKHWNHVRMFKACPEQHLFPSGSASSHVHALDSNPPFPHICQIKSFWPASEVLGEGPLLRKPALLVVFPPPCSRELIQMPSVACTPEKNTLSGSFKVLECNGISLSSDSFGISTSHLSFPMRVQEWG